MQKANARLVHASLGKRLGVGGGGGGMYLGSRQLEGPQEVGCLLEGWSNCVDLMDKVLNANNVVLA